MVQHDFLDEFLHGLRFQIPYLLVYSVGIVLALVNWQRYPAPCLLTLIACIIKVVAGLAYPLASALLPNENFVQAFEATTLLTAIVDAGASGLLLAAIFSARNLLAPRRPAWPREIDDDEETLPLSPSPQASGETGIQERK